MKKIKWESKEQRVDAIKAELQRMNYDVVISDESLLEKYYVARSSTTFSRRVEKSFATQTQLNRFLREWNRYDRIYDSINVLHRDSIEEVAAIRQGL